jgi:hypothetical protein
LGFLLLWFVLGVGYSLLVFMRRWRGAVLLLCGAPAVLRSFLIVRRKLSFLQQSSIFHRQKTSAAYMEFTTSAEATAGGSDVGIASDAIEILKHHPLEVAAYEINMARWAEGIHRGGKT